MRSLLPAAGAITSFISSWFAMFLIDRLLDVLPVGKAYFPDTPIHGLTYGELFATLAIILSSAYAIGLLHGFLYGERHSRLLSLTAAAPLFIMMQALAAATLGMGLIALPIVVAYGTIVAYSMKRGGRRKQGHHHGSRP
ncbi:hypothetical protein RY831_00820 [Noviherbaspirillum sp. CPCC 100848]|uniref:Uncharacterized protein n=1 Tax=Noviherbaspirillum album TaxID=3080276 RepID=A0ABU6J2R6_9BURK|nr:hypothetical protein [Noviherbaspirillum sp. CPCC 100848]MEC4717685.1 hypothetical protein [Noviherbaspirillum sp. CPCC 100848]